MHRFAPDACAYVSCGLPEVPEQGSGEGVVPPGAAASSPLPLNGHSVNPLKVYPSAAAARQSSTRRWREGTAGRRRREKRQQQAVRKKSAAAKYRGRSYGGSRRWQESCYQADDSTVLNQKQTCNLENFKGRKLGHAADVAQNLNASLRLTCVL